MSDTDDRDDADVSSAFVPPEQGHVVVCGLSKLGVSVVEQLRHSDAQVVVIEVDPDPVRERLLVEWEVPLLRGDPRQPAVLERAGVAGAAAVVCLADEDLPNLETAMLVRDLRADVRLVVHLTNAAVGHAVGRLPGPVTVLDAARLSAPTFVEATTSRREHLVEVGDTQFVVMERTVGSSGRLRDLYGDLAPLAVMPPDGEMAICPGRDLRVSPADKVVLLGTAADMADLRQVAVTPLRPAVRRARRWRRSVKASVGIARSIACESGRALPLTLGCLLVVSIVSIVLLTGSYENPDGSRMTVLDAAYFTVETIATVGFGDFSFAAQDVWLRLWAILLMVSGVVLVTVVAALLTNVLVSRRLAESLGRQEAVALRNHVIVVGLGSLGIRVVEALHAAGRAVVVVERDDDNRHLPQARALRVPVVIADATEPSTLQTVSLAHCGGVAVVTSDDLTNIETALAVDDQLHERRARVPVVLRVHDRQLAHTIERYFGFQHVRSMTALAAPWFVGAALGLDVLSSFYVEQQPFLIGRMTIAAGGGLDGVAMRELSARTRVIAIHRTGSAAIEHPPRRDTRFDAGDQAYLVGPYEELLEVLRHEQRAPG